MKQNTLDDRDNVELFMNAVDSEKLEDVIKEPEDLFNTESFKQLPFCKRLWVRSIIALLHILHA